MNPATKVTPMSRENWAMLIDQLGPGFAERAAQHDSEDSFVADNYARLKAARVFSAGVPEEFGGGGASHAELGEMLRRLAHHCGSTALALSMHTHTVMTTVWRWRHDKAPMDKLLKRIADEQLVLTTSGGSDWLQGSGKAVPVEGGYRVSGRKIFSSGSPAGKLLMTSAVLETEGRAPEVLHFGLPLDAPGIKVHDNWRTLGMRGTGSNDVTIEDVFVADAAVGVRRPQGVWSHLFHVVFSNAMPLVYSVYLGIAEAARDLAVKTVARKREDRNVQMLIGEMENELTTVRLVVAQMMEVAKHPRLDLETTNEMVILRTLAGQHAIRTVEKALEAVGGQGYFRASALERHFRDIQAARFHPLTEKPQLMHTGRAALGLDVNG
ncbi:MAG: acyl-CoA dehydrogenase family protein [Dongiaceae bacterium]